MPAVIQVQETFKFLKIIILSDSHSLFVFNWEKKLVYTVDFWSVSDQLDACLTSQSGGSVALISGLRIMDLPVNDLSGVQNNSELCNIGILKVHFRGALTAASIGDVLRTRGCFVFGLVSLYTRAAWWGRKQLSKDRRLVVVAQCLCGVMSCERRNTQTDAEGGKQ